MSYGVFGEYADIDLSTGNVSQYEIPREWFDSYLGGRGIGARLLLNELEKEVSPLEPENILVFATGPFQGTGVAGGGRNVILSVSPVTGSVSDSYAGGFFPHELGRSGYDGLIIRGQSDAPVYILIQSGKVEILDATELWGRDVLRTDRLLRKRHPGARVATIGLGGENRVQYACILNDVSRAAGRPGFGAVMGSKRLKAVVVAGGKQKTIYDTRRFTQLRTEFSKWLMLDPATQRRRDLGTAKCVLELNQLGILPTKNFQEGVFEGASHISGEEIAKSILVRRNTCFGCPVGCKREVTATFQGQEVLADYGGMEYETIASFGSTCLVDDLSAIALAGQKCNQYGIDTIATGVAIATAMEATEKGFLGNEGIAWGDGGAFVMLIDQIARREGLGRLLSQGMGALEKEWGKTFSVHVRGQAVPMHDPRAKKGMGISYVTSPRGATHMEGFDDEMFIDVKDPTPELGVLGTVDWCGWERKPELCLIYENLMSFTNSLVMCAFVSASKAVGPHYPYKRILALLAALTGKEISQGEMLEIGERNYQTMRELSRRSDTWEREITLPKRFANPIPTGPCKGKQVLDEDLKRAVYQYETLRATGAHCHKEG